MSVHVSVDPWDPSYGTSLGEGALADSTAQLTVDYEVPARAWAPRSPGPDTWQPREILVVDGVRRIDARLWFSRRRSARTNTGDCRELCRGRRSD